ncbi:hypothetical protein M378DRAFT_169001 [Amanita muscaria Koide BX008]|uniref:Uncharacterized protein n=1 Tax=Amanita muscaria (strain Koide BX008) TaxID=946122 RepID=A0A0C2WK65_AMAMK|nr:hypothetical protein M378DRAFT_172585 [Amanita muscaria Koide BX008]KIL59721.1 hypothetical protein M378DRAFT_169001 [Amanita muscaria Koide BX008]
MLPLQSANPRAPTVRTILALLGTFGIFPSTTSLSALQMPASTTICPTTYPGPIAEYPTRSGIAERHERCPCGRGRASETIVARSLGGL